MTKAFHVGCAEGPGEFRKKRVLPAMMTAALVYLCLLYTSIDILDHLNRKRGWRWPKRRHFFFSDLHGDSEAFAASLTASGGVGKTGPGPRDFELTHIGGEAVFVIGGDCFDKGPSSLDLLRTIHRLIELGARVRILAGNHDIRLLLGMAAVGSRKDVFNEHFFIRTGQKAIPLLKEIWEEYLKNGRKLKGVPSKRECQKRLYPAEDWFDVFPFWAEGSIHPRQLKRTLGFVDTHLEAMRAATRDQLAV